MRATPTPRTDAAKFNVQWSESSRCPDIVNADFARELERELAQLRAENESNLAAIIRIGAELESATEAHEKLRVGGYELLKSLERLSANFRAVGEARRSIRNITYAEAMEHGAVAIDETLTAFLAAHPEFKQTDR